MLCPWVPSFACSRRPGEESDSGESCRETSSEESMNCDADCSRHDGIRSKRQGPIFEYFEHDPPYSRKPLADKVSSFLFKVSSLQMPAFVFTILASMYYLRFQFLHIGFLGWRHTRAATYYVLAGFRWLGMLLSLSQVAALLWYILLCFFILVIYCWHNGFDTGIQFIGYPRVPHCKIWMLVFWRFIPSQHLEVS